MEEYPLPSSADVTLILLAVLVVELLNSLPLRAYQVVIVIGVSEVVEIHRVTIQLIDPADKVC